RSEKREARSEKREARSEKREARSEKILEGWRVFVNPFCFSGFGSFCLSKGQVLSTPFEAKLLALALQQHLSIPKAKRSRSVSVLFDFKQKRHPEVPFLLSS
ncbi:hypothetical protein B6K85_25960, partial [Vibrio sp. V1B]|uniref:hypothetical protein n=1 Tax=Vibrio sp. V1B TaxID=2047825 RepID=UPI000BB096A6